MPAPVAVFAEIVAKPGRRDELLSLIRDTFPEVEAEPGTVVYAVHLCEDEPDTLRFYEVYEDQAAREAHSGGPAVAKLRRGLADLIAGPPTIIATQPIMAKGHVAG